MHVNFAGGGGNGPHSEVGSHTVQREIILDYIFHSRVCLINEERFQAANLSTKETNEPDTGTDLQDTVTLPDAMLDKDPLLPFVIFLVQVANNARWSCSNFQPVDRDYLRSP